jgi:hypothetical protein
VPVQSTVTCACAVPAKAAVMTAAAMIRVTFIDHSGI